MPRPPRIIIPGLPHHITQRGNYRQQVFFGDEDYRRYLDSLQDHSRGYGVSILAYCLMPNHVHIICVPDKPTALVRMLQRVHSEYARVLHYRLRRTGHLWQARYGSVVMDEKHLWAGMVYIEQNPSRAGLVDQPWQWRWSSARAHLSEADGGFLDLIEWRTRYTPENWKLCLENGLADGLLVARLRESTQNGWPLGSDEFLDRLERNHHIRVRPKPPGPRPKARKSTVSTASSDSQTASAHG